jgi:hypothetical protein
MTTIAKRDLDIQQTNVERFPQESYLILITLASSNPQPSVAPLVNVMLKNENRWQTPVNITINSALESNHSATVRKVP